ncbi:MAG: hypothetical protein LBR57_02490 [Alistipes sp.]|jgi:hypothetical protein|nr:hypothetical protein [Alistipes sp.]
MKTNTLIVRALILLGFGGAVGLTGCGASRVQRSRNPEKTAETTTAGDKPAAPDADSVRKWDPGRPVMVMYGVPPSQYNPDGPVRGTRPEMRQTPDRSE